MYEKEKELVDTLLVNSEKCYNLTKGGYGGWSHVDSSGENNCMKNPLIKEKVKKSWKQNPLNLEKVKLNLKRATEKAILANKGKKRPEHSTFMKENWHKFNDPQKIAEVKRKITYVLKSPSGVEYITNALVPFIKKHNLSGTTIYYSAKNNGRPITKGRSKGWLCKIYQQ